MSSMRPIFSKAVYSHAQHVCEYSSVVTVMYGVTVPDSRSRSAICPHTTHNTLASSLPSIVGDADSHSLDAGSLDDTRASMPSSRGIVGDCRCDLASYSRSYPRAELCFSWS